MKLLLKLLLNFVLVLVGVPMFIIKRIHKVPVPLPPPNLTDMMLRAKYLDEQQKLRPVATPVAPDGREANPSLMNPVDVGDPNHDG